MYNTINSTNNNTMNNTLTANELKMKGISAVTPNAKKGMETIITVRGNPEFVILPVREYNRLKDCELESAIMESEEDIKAGRYKKDSIEKHLKRICND